MAPEIIKQDGHGRQADIWSVACTVIEMATGKPPWSQFQSQVGASVKSRSMHQQSCNKRGRRRFWPHAMTTQQAV